MVHSWPGALRQNKAEGITAHKKLSPEFPERGSVFDWIFNAEERQGGKWRLGDELVAL